MSRSLGHFKRATEASQSVRLWWIWCSGKSLWTMLIVMLFLPLLLVAFCYFFTIYVGKFWSASFLSFHGIIDCLWKWPVNSSNQNSLATATVLLICITFLLVEGWKCVLTQGSCFSSLSLDFGKNEDKHNFECRTSCSFNHFSLMLQKRLPLRHNLAALTDTTWKRA